MICIRVFEMCQSRREWENKEIGNSAFVRYREANT